MLQPGLRSLERATDQMVKRDYAATVDQKVKYRYCPHQGVFETELVPEIPAHAPTLRICDDQKEQNGDCGRASKQSQRQQRSGPEPAHPAQPRPQLARPIAVVVKLGGE